MVVADPPCTPAVDSLTAARLAKFPTERAVGAILRALVEQEAGP